ncbi:hypothetical protein IAT38_001964 [Cryptococcus sp. DSM 104549]
MSSSPDSAVVTQLKRVTELKDRVGSRNSPASKQIILAEYPDLRELLELIHDPDHRVHILMRSVVTYMDTKSPDPRFTPPSAHTPSTIIELFERLSSRQVVGAQAKQLIVDFLKVHGVLDNDDLVQTFGQLLDRNLAAGYGAKILSGVKWLSIDDAEEVVSLQRNRRAANPSQPADDSAEDDSGETPIRADFSPLEKFDVALGSNVTAPFGSLFIAKGGGTNVYYVSRKLDGVRAVTLLDIFVPSSTSSPLEIAHTHFVSRSGKPFFSLGKLEEQLALLVGFPKLREWLDRDPEVIQTRKGGVVKRLVLDGEACVMRPKTAEERSATLPRDDGSASNMWDADYPLTEDFASTVGAVRSGGTIPLLNYYCFDVLSWAEFRNKSAVSHPGLGKTFGERIVELNELTTWLGAEQERRGVEPENRVVKELVQCRVEQAGDIEDMVWRASNEGWEGLMLRLDKPYQGRRTNDIRKFKQWQDAEYTVVSADNNTMRLSVNGKFEQRLALANVWISHKGHPVSVGSGFSAEQRLRYAEHPEDIVGKEITVEYFSESEVAGREKKSLRFPRVKKVWEEGKRDV